MSIHPRAKEGHVARTLAVSVIAFAVAMVWTSPPAVADPLDETTVFAIGKCFDPGQPVPQEPVRFDYNCDNTGVMADMTWASWGVDGAEGSGTDRSSASRTARKARCSRIPSWCMRGIRCRPPQSTARQRFSSTRS